MSEWKSTGTPGVYVAHQKKCPWHADKRCRCEPSYRGRRRPPTGGPPQWGPISKERSSVLTWLAAVEKGAPAIRARIDEGRTFGSLADEWITGVKAGKIGKRRGRSERRYSPTTLAGYERSLAYVLVPEFGHRPADGIAAHEWQRWVDGMTRAGLSRSRIANHLAVARSVYAWAARPTRQLVSANPIVGVELPPNDEQPRERVATAEEAQALLAALEPADRVPYGLALYAGLRRSEIDRQDWRDVDLEQSLLVVRQSKSDAGTDRVVPMADPLRPILRGALLRQGRPTSGPVRGSVSVMSGRLAKRAAAAWESAGLELIGLHESRHTYASFLVAARYTLKEVMDYLGHADLQTTQRYVKKLPPVGGETNPAERLNAYLAGDRETGVS